MRNCFALLAFAVTIGLTIQSSAAPYPVDPKCSDLFTGTEYDLTGPAPAVKGCIPQADANGVQPDTVLHPNEVWTCEVTINGETFPRSKPPGSFYAVGEVADLGLFGVHPMTIQCLDGQGNRGAALTVDARFPAPPLGAPGAPILLNP